MPDDNRVQIGEFGLLGFLSRPNPLPVCKKAVEDHHNEYTDVLNASRKAMQAVEEKGRQGLLGGRGVSEEKHKVATAAVEQLRKINASFDRGISLRKRKAQDALAVKLEYGENENLARVTIREGRLLDRLAKLEGFQQKAELIKAASSDDIELLRAAAHAHRLDGIDLEAVQEAIEVHAKRHNPEAAEELAQIEGVLIVFGHNYSVAVEHLAKAAGVEFRDLHVDGNTGLPA